MALWIPHTQNKKGVLYLSDDLWRLLMAKLHEEGTREKKAHKWQCLHRSDGGNAGVAVISVQRRSRYVCLFKWQLSRPAGRKRLLHHGRCVSEAQ